MLGNANFLLFSCLFSCLSSKHKLKNTSSQLYELLIRGLLVLIVNNHKKSSFWYFIGACKHNMVLGLGFVRSGLNVYWGSFLAVRSRSRQYVQEEEEVQWEIWSAEIRQFGCCSTESIKTGSGTLAAFIFGPMPLSQLFLFPRTILNCLRVPPSVSLLLGRS